MSVSSQRLPPLFNKAAMMNIGFAEATRLWKDQFDCILLHDIDLLMEDDRNLITCGKYPMHYGVYLDRKNYTSV